MQVYIPVDDGRVWARAKLRNGEAYRGGSKTVVVAAGASVETILPEEVMLVDGSDLSNMEDLCDLNHVHEGSILDAIDERTKAGKPYTAAGDVVLAVNPFRWLEGLYTREQRKGHEEGTAKTAHAYSVSAAAARGAARGDDQSILVSGESGAGKTETVKLLLAHLADIAEHGQSTRTVVSQVLRAGPLLESFGNAATLRNGNSSRFAKFVRVEFERETMSIDGSWCETALLEKTRVVERTAGERAFHVFYELGAAEPKLGSAQYLVSSNGTAKSQAVADASAKLARGKDDADSRAEMLAGLASVCGLDAAECATLLSTVAATLVLGDVDFKNDLTLSSHEAKSTSDDAAVTVDPSELAEAAARLGCNAEALKSGLIERDVRGATVRLDAVQATSSRDALAKELYARLFETIVALSNEATRATRQDSRSPVVIGMLDLFGFEFYGTSNGFEQLLINLANERLQQRFVADVLARAQRELMAEGVPWDSIEFDDNANVLRLLEARAGLVDILNEECVRGGSGSDVNFVDKLLSFHKGHASLSIPRIRQHTVGDAQPFIISHYAGAVLYAPKGWVERNRDVLPTRLENAMLEAAALPDAPEFAPAKVFAARGGGAADTNTPHSSKQRVVTQKRGRGSCLSASETVGSKFRAQLRTLMRDIAATKCRYVRCVRPNDKAIPMGKKGAFDRLAVVEQLRCCGVLSALKVARAGYPDREALPTFVERYAVCARIIFSSSSSKGNTSAAMTRSTLLQRCRGDSMLLIEETEDADDGLVMGAHAQDDDNQLILDPAVVRLCAPYRQVAAELVAGLEKHATREKKLMAANGTRAQPRTAGSSSKIQGRVFVGRTKVFLRDGALDELESLRNIACFEYVACIQRRARGRAQWLRYVRILEAVVKVEAFGRAVIARAEAQRRWARLAACWKVQAFWRRTLVRLKGELKAGLGAALRLQTALARPYLARDRFAKVKTLREKGATYDDIQVRLKALAAAPPPPIKKRPLVEPTAKKNKPSSTTPAKAAALVKTTSTEEAQAAAKEVEAAKQEAAQTVAAARSIAADAEAALAELRLENQTLRERCALAEARAESWRLTAARCKAREAQLVAIVDECKREARRAHEMARREKRLGAVMRDDGESASYSRLRHAMLQADPKVTPALRKRLLENRKPNQKIVVTQIELKEFRDGLIKEGLDVKKHSTSGKAVKRKLRLVESGDAIFWEKADESRSKKEQYNLAECIEVRAANDVDPDEKNKLVCGTKTLRRSMDAAQSKCAFSFIYVQRTIDIQLDEPERTKLVLRYMRALVCEAKSKAMKKILYEVNETPHNDHDNKDVDDRRQASSPPPPNHTTPLSTKKSPPPTSKPPSAARKSHFW